MTPSLFPLVAPYQTSKEKLSVPTCGSIVLFRMRELFSRNKYFEQLCKSLGIYLARRERLKWHTNQWLKFILRNKQKTSDPIVERVSLLRSDNTRCDTTGYSDFPFYIDCQHVRVIYDVTSWGHPSNIAVMYSKLAKGFMFLLASILVVSHRHTLLTVFLQPQLMHLC